DSLVPAAVAVSPGGPTHVLISDEVAEHIAGCNMAFRRQALLDLGGFDPAYRAAGDDVDICWRFQDAGYTIGFSAAATVWPFRRAAVVASAGDLFRRIRPRPVPDDVRAALVLDRIPAADLRMERRRAGAGIAGGDSRRLVLAAADAAAGDLDDVHQRRAEGGDRSAFQRAEGARAGRPSDLSRPAVARLGAAEMAHQADADVGPRCPNR